MRLRFVKTLLYTYCMDNIRPPFKVDVAGTFLLPQTLKDAREQYRFGQIGLETLRATEDEEIRKLVDRLKTIGLKVVTDGNYRAAQGVLDFICCLDGVQLRSGKKNQIELTKRIDVHRHPVVGNYTFLTGITDGDVIAKQVLPAPSVVLSRLLKDDPERVKILYPAVDLLFDDINRVYRRIITELYDSGCRYIQFDDPAKVITQDMIDINNIVLYNQPADLFIAFHASSDMLMSTNGVNAFLLNYDTECCSRYKLMWYVKEQQATFGFIPSYYPVEEDLDEYRSKIEEIRRYIPLNRFTLCIPNANTLPSEKFEDAKEKQWHTFEMAMRMAKELWPDEVFVEFE